MHCFFKKKLAGRVTFTLCVPLGDMEVILSRHRQSYETPEEMKFESGSNFTEQSLNSLDSLIFIPSAKQTHFLSSFLFETGSHLSLADFKITTQQRMTLNL